MRSAFQVRLVEVEGWLDGVQEMMSRDTAACGAKENLQEELSQCKVQKPNLAAEKAPFPVDSWPFRRKLFICLSFKGVRE